MTFLILSLLNPNGILLVLLPCIDLFHALIFLIPKGGDPKCPSQLNLITLCNVVYKVIIKIVVTHNSFFQNQNIGDNVVALKLVLEKAFDKFE